jgi:hypothetical protein
MSTRPQPDPQTLYPFNPCRHLRAPEGGCISVPVACHRPPVSGTRLAEVAQRAAELRDRLLPHPSQPLIQESDQTLDALLSSQWGLLDRQPLEDTGIFLTLQTQDEVADLLSGVTLRLAADQNVHEETSLRYHDDLLLPMLNGINHAISLLHPHLPWWAWHRCCDQVRH